MNLKRVCLFLYVLMNHDKFLCHMRMHTQYFNDLMPHPAIDRYSVIRIIELLDILLVPLWDGPGVWFEL